MMKIRYSDAFEGAGHFGNIYFFFRFNSTSRIVLDIQNSTIQQHTMMLQLDTTRSSDSIPVIQHPHMIMSGEQRQSSLVCPVGLDTSPCSFGLMFCAVSRLGCDAVA